MKYQFHLSFDETFAVIFFNCFSRTFSKQEIKIYYFWGVETQKSRKNNNFLKKQYELFRIDLFTCIFVVYVKLSLREH